MRAGYAEVVKYGLIGDAAFFDWCEANWQGVFDGGPERDEAVAHSCRAKAAVVVRDEREEGDRALLNLGHTFGHALERITAYDSARLVHGEGVAIGLCLAFRFSAFLGLCPAAGCRAASRRTLPRVGLPTRLGTCPAATATWMSCSTAWRRTRRSRRGALTFILARESARASSRPAFAVDKVRAFLDQRNRRRSRS